MFLSSHTTGRGTKGRATITLEVLSRAVNEPEAITTLTREIPYVSNLWSVFMVFDVGVIEHAW